MEKLVALDWMSISRRNSTFFPQNTTVTLMKLVGLLWIDMGTTVDRTSCSQRSLVYVVLGLVFERKINCNLKQIPRLSFAGVYNLT